MVQSGPSRLTTSRSARQPVLALACPTWIIVALALLLTGGVASLAAIRPVLGAVAVAGGLFAVVLVRLGRDASLVWLLVVPWQFVPGIDANIIFNPWLWVALIRLMTARRLHGHSPTKMSLAIVVLLPASYLLEWLFFGVSEPSLLLWMIPYIPLAVSFALVPPDPTVIQRHLFYVGVAMAALVLLEATTGLSLNHYLESSLSVQEYLQSGRALGPTGNPLFTSSVLMIAFFLPPNGYIWSRLAQAAILIAALLTGSKSALIGLAVGVLLLAISKGLKRFVASSVVILVVLLGVQSAADSAFNNVFQRFAVFSDLRTSDPDRAFTTDFILNWLQTHPFGGTPIGAALIDKRLLSPVSGGSRFGIESTWLAVAADTGVVLVGLCLVLIGIHALRYRADPKAHAVLAFAVSLFFWNGLYGAWVIGPLLLLLVMTPAAGLYPSNPGTKTEPAQVHLKWGPAPWAH